MPAPTRTGSTYTPGEVLESAFTSATATPVLIRHYGPLKTRTNWNSAVVIECQPFGFDLCGTLWQPAGSGFTVHGPGQSGWTQPRTIRISKSSTSIPRPGVCRVTYAAGENTTHPFGPVTRCADVTANPFVVWPILCGEEAEGTEVRSFVFAIGPDCDGDGVRDTQSCSSNCHIANFNHVGGVTVQDLFDFLTAYFSDCLVATGTAPCYQSADVNNSGGVSVQDIFDYLGHHFTCQ